MVWKVDGKKIRFHRIASLAFVTATPATLYGFWLYRSGIVSESDEFVASRKKQNVPIKPDKHQLLAAAAHEARKVSQALRDSNRGNWLDMIKYRRKTYASARGHVLDVGMASGRNLEAVGELPGIKSYTGVDMIQIGLDCAKERLIGNLMPKDEDMRFPAPAQFVMHDALNLPFPDNTFDTVITSFYIAAVDEPIPALKEIVRVTKPGGRILLLEYGLSKYWLMRKFYAAVKIMPDPKFPWEFGFFDDRDMKALCKEAGVGFRRFKCAGWGTLSMISGAPHQSVRKSNVRPVIPEGKCPPLIDNAPPYFQYFPEESVVEANENEHALTNLVKDISATAVA